MPYRAPSTPCASDFEGIAEAVQKRSGARPPEATLRAVLLAGILGLLLAPGTVGFIQTARAQPARPALLARSFSGQFCICAVPSATPSPRLSNLETNQNLARLAPTLVPTSCERIKHVLWRELGATAPWQGRIVLVLLPTISADDPVTITSEQFPDRWQYRVDLPELVDRTRYVRSIVQVLLLEMANRKASVRSAEIPIWLLEGLTQEIMASSTKDELIPPPPQPTSDIMRPGVSFTLVDALRQNPLEKAHANFSHSTPLSFQDLSWPSPEQVGPTVSEVYRDSTQLFVDRLLALPNGRASLRAMIEALPEQYNWQFAFLRAFHSYFQRPLDIEKWWALQAVHFTGRDLAQTWPPAESWTKLDELIRSGVQIRYGTNDLPVHGEVPLQTIIQDWDPARQFQALQAKLEELEMLRSRVAFELVPLVDEYHRVLATYLHEGVGSGARPGKKAARHLVGETVERLAALDGQRMALRPAGPPQTVPNPSRGAGTNRIGQAFATKSRFQP